jgi:acyl-CoA reductase-like NAD-dependent aldehyde dehydrogenase
MAHTQVGDRWEDNPILAALEDRKNVCCRANLGPVTLVRPFDDEADAIVQADDRPFGAAASVWTRHAGRSVRVGDRLDDGTHLRDRVPHRHPLVAVPLQFSTREG